MIIPENLTFITPFVVITVIILLGRHWGVINLKYPIGFSILVLGIAFSGSFLLNWKYIIPFLRVGRGLYLPEGTLIAYLMDFSISIPLGIILSLLGSLISGMTARSYLRLCVFNVFLYTANYLFFMLTLFICLPRI